MRIADRYFGRAQAMEAFRLARDNQADFIVRPRWNALRLRQADGRRFDPIAALGALPAADAPQEGVVQAEPGRHQAALPRRPILPRKPAAAATATRRALLRHASRKQKKLDPRTLAQVHADWDQSA